MKNERTFDYVKNAGPGVSPSEDLKNHLANNDHSMKWFYDEFYLPADKKVSHRIRPKSYIEFLVDLNWCKVMPRSIHVAFSNYKRFLKSC